jgi:Family of unknown function (DUF6152)
MKDRLAKSLALFVGVLTACGLMWAHHGSTVSYDLTKEVVMNGTVTEFDWQNPHVFVMYDVKDDKGKVVHWGAETHSPLICQNEDHWTKSTFKPGDQITVTVFPARGGSPRGLLAKVVRDGQVLLDDTARSRQ